MKHTKIVCQHLLLYLLYKHKISLCVPLKKGAQIMILLLFGVCVSSFLHKSSFPFSMGGTMAETFQLIQCPCLCTELNLVFIFRNFGPNFVEKNLPSRWCRTMYTAPRPGWRLYQKGVIVDGLHVILKDTLYDENILNMDQIWLKSTLHCNLFFLRILLYGILFNKNVYFPKCCNFIN